MIYIKNWKLQNKKLVLTGRQRRIYSGTSFYVPPQARWKWLQGRAKLPTIGKDIDEAMDSIERDNASLKGVLPKDYGRPALDKQRLGELIDLIGSITLSKGGNGKGKDVLGFVFEYFLGQFADAEGKKADSFTHHKAL